jgi:hypothetical protein
MQVRFLMHLPPMPSDADADYVHKPVEYVEIEGLGTGRDVVCRAATDADRQKFKAEYAAFKPPAKKVKP